MVRTSQSFAMACLMAAAPARAFTTRLHMDAPRATALFSTEGNDEAAPDLILGGEEMQQQLNQLKSKYPTSEADYLAAARARAAAKTPSASQSASDEEWQKIAEEKKKAGIGVDDDSGWESSLEDAESAILIMSTNEDGEPEVDDEPTLLL